MMSCLLGILMMMLTDSWSSWGGGDGAFRRPTLKVDLDPSTPTFEKIWKRELGDGYSSFVIHEELAWGHYRPWTGPKELARKESIVALDLVTGNTVHEIVYEAAAYENQESMGGQGPHATPLVHGSSIIFLGYTGIVHGIDAKNGEILFSIDLVKTYGAKPVQFGWGASPVGVGNSVVLPVFSDQCGFLAIDPVSGEVQWKSEGANASYVTPMLIEHDCRPFLITVTGDEVWCLDAQEGRVAARISHRKPGQTNYAMITPVDDGGFVLSGQGSGGSRLIQLVAGEDRLSMEEKWFQPRLKFSHGSMIRDGDLIVGSTGTTVLGFNWQNGSIAFRTRGFPEANLIGLCGQLLVLSENGLLCTATYSDSRMEKKAEVFLKSERCWTCPTLLDDGVLIRDRHHISRWKVPLRRVSPQAPMTLSTEPEPIVFSTALKMLAAGEYQDANGEILEVREKNDRLVIDGLGGSWTLQAMDEFEGAFEGKESKCFFEVNQDNELTSLRIESGDSQRVFSKSETPELPLEESEAQEFVGAYQVDENVEIVISWKDQGLILTSTIYGRYEFRLRRRAPDSFSVHPIEVPFGIPQTLIRFLREKSSDVTGLEVIRVTEIVPARRK